jgi:hypothetical protein
VVELLKLIAATLTLLHFLGPWGSLALIAAIVALGLGLYFNGERLMEWFIDSGARAFGSVLKDAAVTIHSVTPAPEPDASVWRTGDDEEDDAFEEDLDASGLPEGDFDWFKFDITIEPKPNAQGEPAAWEPGMVHLRIKEDKSPHPLEFNADCLIAQVERWQDGEFAVFDSGTLVGPGRIQLYAGIVPGAHELQFTYVGVTLAEVRLPASRSSSRPSAPSRIRRTASEARP